MDALILSYGLDTNGGNERFRRAAEKWGDHKDVLRAFAIGKDDPAGVVARYTLAAEKLDTLRIRSAHRQSHYFEFPHDIIWTRATEKEIRVLADEADVIHLNNSAMAAQRFRLRKPMLLHHHGSLFRNDPPKSLEIAKHHRMLQAVSTIDLQKPAPDILNWLPSTYDIDELVAFGNQNGREPDGRVRIVHCPTNRALKATDLLIQVVTELQKELPVDLVLVEGKTWRESLTEKAKADIVFDQLMFGYGCNSIEAWALGVPVISGADEWTIARMLKEWDGLPFYEATEKTLKGAVRQMVQSADLRAEYAAAGMAHIRKYHDERPALARLAELYAKTIAHYQRLRIPGKGQKAVTFKSKTNRTVSVDGERVVFKADNVIKVTDPYVISRLRYFARERRNWGIEEVA